MVFFSEKLQSTKTKNHLPSSVLNFIIAKNYRVLKLGDAGLIVVNSFIIAKNYRVLKLMQKYLNSSYGFIIAKNYRVLKHNR